MRLVHTHFLVLDEAGLVARVCKMATGLEHIIIFRGPLYFLL